MKVGDKMPDFELPNHKGKHFSTDKLREKHSLLIFVYPKLGIPVCIRELLMLKNHHSDFLDAGLDVMVVSTEEPDGIGLFVKTYEIPFLIVSDVDMQVRCMLHIPSYWAGVIPHRAAILVSMDGVVEDIFFSHFGVKKEIRRILTAVRKRQRS